MQDSLRVCLYGKNGCGKCESARKKLEWFRERGVINAYEKVDLEAPPVDWRSTGIVSAMALYQMTSDLPIVSINGEPLSYPKAMSILKSSRRNGNGKKILCKKEASE